MYEYATKDNIKVGDHVTECLWSDKHSYTVVKILNKYVDVQRDEQYIDRENWTPEIIPGGFAGHCTNNYEQKWIVKSDPNGVIKRLSVRSKDGKLKTKGSRRADIILGAHPFYDYNF